MTGSQRLIPAHAGKTGTGWGPGRAGRAHPRSRGENVFAVLMIVLIWGSSPLTRGKPVTHARVWEAGRLIPAHAGKTKGKAIVSFDAGAHPRSRGENRVIWVDSVPTAGSSPLTRGKLNRRRHGQGGLGLIPAHAGKTPVSVGPPVLDRAHPRSRGENHGQYFGASGVPGSSPLTRGKPTRMASPVRMQGLIPAHAGKTLAAHPRAPGARAHPRSRGENVNGVITLQGVEGSSPLTRGKRTDIEAVLPRRRLIPAHAGKTDTTPSMGVPSTAHPRSRGENPKSNAAFGGAGGSSPLTRGKRGQVGGDADQVGLIPAHAGKTP